MEPLRGRWEPDKGHVAPPGAGGDLRGGESVGALACTHPVLLRGWR